MGWQRRVGRIANFLEGYYDALMHAYTKYLDRNPSIQIVSYRGFGSRKRIFLKGRVLKDKRISTGSETDSRWRNFVNTLKRFNSSEVPEARVQVSIRGWSGEIRADEEGYFDVIVEPAIPLDPDRLWHDVEFDLLEPRTSAGAVHQTGQFLVPPLTARFGVISDMDDTVVQTGAGNVFGMMSTVLLGNALTRLPFEGVASFYQSLQGVELNPLFYVSSSPWNFYDILTEFFRLHQIPMGPLFLRDWGVSEEEVLPTDHRNHKVTTIRRILDTLPELPFILIGDSSQEDPEIYQEIAAIHPGRILGIYIRAVGHNPQRFERIKAIGNHVHEMGSVLVLAPETRDAASHAAQMGWIQSTGSQIQNI